MKDEHDFLDWLVIGLRNKVINERSAKKYYVERYGEIEMNKFLIKLYNKDVD